MRLKTRNEIHKGKVQVSSSHKTARGLPVTPSGPQPCITDNICVTWLQAVAQRRSIRPCWGSPVMQQSQGKPYTMSASRYSHSV